MLTDQQARLNALNTKQSFIVQAPAGSGKTELLTQRFLKLLTQVSSPEEIIAITFTRKAASQMRHRILSALTRACDGHSPDEPHKQLTFTLAHDALQSDRRHQWHILDNPNRLRILTIDALAGFLSAQIPILAGFGSKPTITEDAKALYKEAASHLLHSITQQNSWSTHIETLLLHLDNKAERVIELLCSILAKREQWLPYILTYHSNTDLLHAQLEQGLVNIAYEIICHTHTALQPHLDELIQLLAHGAQNLAAEGVTADPALHFLNHNPLPSDVAQLDAWKALATLLLTQDDHFRKSIDKRQGFLAKSAEKTRMLQLLGLFSEDTLLHDHVIQLKYCPDLHYPTAQKKMITALTQLLPLLYAQLRLTFQKYNEIDFVELNLAALRALGEEEEPTDLALYLDYQIQHLLIDEFQDTSITQYTLLERLTRGWELHDGRSLFLVGDPMQSIYRFRDAEVGLFIRAQTQGIHALPLTPLTLQNNHRSDKKIITWINKQFKSIFPTHADIAEGAVPYVESIPTQNYESMGVHCYSFLDAPAAQEALTVTQLIHTLQTKHPDDSIAILVRSRNQLRDIITLLHAQRVPFEALDLEKLIDLPEIQDLLTLTRVVLHREDRIAWYALLRSPICGLTLHDLHHLSQLSTQQSLWQTIQSNPILSADGQQRLQRIRTVLTAYFNEHYRKPFELALKGLWQALGFTEILSSQQQYNALNFFKLIAHQVDSGKPIINIEQLMQYLSKTYIEPQKTTSRLSIMTIHKSKGLEFDHVILPGLHAKTATDQHQLMLWLERPNYLGNIDFVLAPIKQANTNTDSIYHYLQRHEKRKLVFETARLLYVATTRSKKSLHLMACLNTNEHGEILFQPDSFAHMLQAEFIKNIHPHAPHLRDEQITAIPQLMRIPSGWTSSYSITSEEHNLENPLPPIDHDTHRVLGTVMHLLLADETQRSIDCAKRLLRQHGFNAMQLPQALDKIQLMLLNLQSNAHAKWIFDSTHQDAHNEYPITAIIKGKIRHLIIDRTFVEDGIRWIIDYKTTVPTDEHHDVFLKQQLELHREQLETYALALQGIEVRPIRLGLYFPVCGLWIEALTITASQTETKLL